ncbi:uncharacterized protein LOC112590632 [Harpegnathos saltator]|uniref:Chitin-binding type-2 domain-containing protein n=1 Tax=Harpegnathos saltator TaxID=610380 RepID=E2BZ30_HARSA|nr:uncharacterized protein LOC112590632 [Harpegnathos saltator]EFN79032.1 hypothetical protein EAI_12947 [Harpegnathos saltator]
MPITLRTLCFVTAVLCNAQRSLEHEIPRRSFLSRRAIDGSRGRKYFDPNEEGAFDSYGSAGGQYDPYDHVTDLSDIRKNVPGEPGVDYPAYSTLPQTGFTCEGRSRGYYADEAAGCQVFHVCHDVLVSSFLCPIGSTFSQKLLTCDWWTKVDCSTSNRYLEVNRNNYQVDDDEMIRNAYAMISLQAAEDVTKDGLVDPDSSARIMDYSALGGRTVGYTPGFRRITDYPAVDATGNDLPSGFEDYPQRDDRHVLHYNRYQEKVAKTSSAYQGKFHLEDKERSPYHASPIIRHDYQGRSTGDNGFQDDYRAPDGFTNRLQASYAPTVPTVTTTTRRMYSPTVPTTYRPSTLAYSKLDLLMDSSDHLYAHSKSLVTPSTVVRQSDDLKNADSGTSEVLRRYDEPGKSESLSSPRTGDDDRQDDEARLDLKGKPRETSFRINVTDTTDEDKVIRQQNDRPLMENDDDDESAEDIETKDSIGIARALSNPRGKIIVQSQDPVAQVLKSEQGAPATFSPSRTNSSRSPGSSDDVHTVKEPTQTLKKPNVAAINETDSDDSTEDYEDVTNSTTKSFDDRTTLLLTRLQRGDNDSSTILVTAQPATSTTARISQLANHSSSNENQTTVDQNLSSSRSVSSFDDELADLEVPRPALFLRPPLQGFFINVPEETRYAPIDGSFETSWGPVTTTLGTSESSVYNENVDEQPLIEYADEGLLATTPNLEVYPAERLVSDTPTPIPWLGSSWHERTVLNIPMTDIVPPIVDYNDSFGDFVPPNRDADERVEAPRTQNVPENPKNNDSEAEVLNRYNTGFQFTIRDAIKAQVGSKPDVKSPCYFSASDERTTHCETSSAGPQAAPAAPSVEEKAISIGVQATTSVPEQPRLFEGGTRSSRKPVTPVLDKSLRFSSVANDNVGIEETTLKAVTPRDVLQAKEPEEEPEETTTRATTTSSLLHPIRPGSLEQIEEVIDRQNSPFEVSLTVKKDENLDTTSDDFISRLVAQHQQSTGVLKDHLGDFEIIKSVEPEDEVTSISQAPGSPSHAFPSEDNGSSKVSLSKAQADQADQAKDSMSNVSMLSLLQLMAELLKLDRLPRPFSVQDLRNAELEPPTELEPDEAPFVTMNPLLDQSQGKTPFQSVISKASVFDVLNIPSDIAELNTSPTAGPVQQSFVTISPLIDQPQVKPSLRKTNPTTSAFDTLTLAADNSRPSLHLGRDRASSVTTGISVDQSQIKTPLRKASPKVSPFDDALKTTSNIAFTQSPELSSRGNPEHVIETKTARSRPSVKVNRPFQKQEILEQLTENFGQPLYRGDSIQRSLIFDLPQVQRNLDFESGLPVDERATDEAEEDPESSTTGTTLPPTSTTTTTTTTQRTVTMAESERTIVETEFVPSIGFSFDTNEGREEYVEAILGGLIDQHTDGNDPSVARLTHEAPKNETLRTERHDSPEDV